MYGPAKYAIVIVTAALLAYMLIPLAILFLEVRENPNAIGLELKPLEVLENQSVVVEVIYKHEISVTFNNLTIVIAGSTISFGDVREGIYERNITIPLSALEGKSSTKISFVLAGIYPVTMEVQGK
ncbi:MAG: hypothetical protein QW039_03185 [Fervidicoccaceae archaeon]